MSEQDRVSSSDRVQHLTFRTYRTAHASARDREARRDDVSKALEDSNHVREAVAVMQESRRRRVSCGPRLVRRLLPRADIRLHGSRP